MVYLNVAGFNFSIKTSFITYFISEANKYAYIFEIQISVIECVITPHQTKLNFVFVAPYITYQADKI